MNKKRRRGRPRSADPLISKRVTLSLSAEEWEQIEKVQKDRSLSATVRDLCFKTPPMAKNMYAALADKMFEFYLPKNPPGEKQKTKHKTIEPLKIAFDNFQEVGSIWSSEDLVFAIAGQIHNVLEKEDVYCRADLHDTERDYAERYNDELKAIHEFAVACVDLFQDRFKGDSAIAAEWKEKYLDAFCFAVISTLQKPKEFWSKTPPYKGRSLRDNQLS